MNDSCLDQSVRRPVSSGLRLARIISEATTNPGGQPVISPRAFPKALLTTAIPKRWLADRVVATHLANGVNLLFPAGERFFVRSVRKLAAKLPKGDPLHEDVKGFAAQEGHHAGAHEVVFEVLQAQGYDIKTFLGVYEKLAFGVIEPIAPPSLRLAVTAACEHFTAVMAENFLTRMQSIPMDESMRALLAWHSVEEIEHRAVAFDVFQKVDGRYEVRMAGLAVAAVLLAGFWVAATATLLAQEDAPLRALQKERHELKEDQPFSDRVFGRGIREYVRRDFHPLTNKRVDDLASAQVATFAWHSANDSRQM